MAQIPALPSLSARTRARKRSSPWAGGSGSGSAYPAGARGRRNPQHTHVSETVLTDRRGWIWVSPGANFTGEKSGVSAGAEQRERGQAGRAGAGSGKAPFPALISQPVLPCMGACPRLLGGQRQGPWKGLQWLWEAERDPQRQRPPRDQGKGGVGQCSPYISCPPCGGLRAPAGWGRGSHWPLGAC